MIIMIFSGICNGAFIYTIRYLLARNKYLNKSIDIDPLTLALNSNYFFNKLKLSYDKDNPVSMIMFDIDNFKNINDTYGHVVGDRVLKKLIGNISIKLREHDRLIRVGGDEFIIVLPSTNLVQAEVIANRIKDKISNKKIILRDGLRIAVTISQGICKLNKDEDIIDLYYNADMAMYKAKQYGKNQILVHA